MASERQPLLPSASHPGGLSARSGKSSDVGAERVKAPMEKYFDQWEYEAMIMFIVLLNAVSIGMQIDYPAALPLYGWFIVNLGFWSVFFIECVAKIYVMGFWNYFSSNWNKYDLFLTFACTIEIAVTYSVYMYHHESALYHEFRHYVSADFIEIARLLRLLRLAHAFSQLNVLASSFFSSLQALGWIMAGTGLWFYLCACICTIFLGRQEIPGESDDIKEVRERFGSISFSLFALFEIMTLEGWTDYARPLLDHHPLWVLFFIFFIFVSAFFLLNLVTAVVVDRTVAAQEQAKESEEESGKASRLRFVADFVAMLRDRNGGKDSISLEHLYDYAAHPTGDMTPRGDHSHFVKSMAVILDHEDNNCVSLSELEELWSSYETPLNTETLIRFNIAQARRMDYQERLSVTVLHVLEKMSGQSLNLHEDIFKNTASFLRHEGASPVRVRTDSVLTSGR